MKVIFRLSMLYILPLLLTGCIRDDMSGCFQAQAGLALKFRYVTSPDSRLLVNSIEVDRLSVFIFDEKGLFISRVNDSLNLINEDYTLELPYKQGSYQFVTWVGYDETTYQTSMCVPGETHINDLFLYLKRQDNNEVVNQPKLLYHGMHDVVTLNQKKKTTVLISLKQMTNHIRVIAHHLDNNPDNTISIEDTNGKYGYDSQFANDDRVTYIPHYMDSLKKSDPLIADFNVMKLENGRTPHLQIMDGTGTVRYDENLIGKLLAANPSINFEYDHDFTIEISFNNYIPVNIKINGWEIIDEYLPAYFTG